MYLIVPTYFYITYTQLNVVDIYSQNLKVLDKITITPK